jgi:hypothetical protein
MYIGVHRPKSQPGGDNKGSSVNLINYLIKEDEEKEYEGFFNHDKERILSGEAIKLIDDNSKGLEKKDSKHFMLTINPSKKEIEHLLKDIIQQRKIENISDLSKIELNAYHEKLRDYTKEVMNLYAEQFDREVNGYKITGKDLIYVAKIEEQRHYSPDEKMTKENRQILREIKEMGAKDKSRIKELESKLHRNSKGEIIRAGDLKEGFNSHVHIVVSRYDKEKITKMSPLANSRGYSREHQVGGRNVKVGFSRLEFSINCENKFDQKFEYERQDYERKVYQVQKARNDRQAKGDITTTIDKYGHIDPINSMKFAYQSGQNIINGKSVNLQAFKPENLSKMFVNQIPVQEFRSKMDAINQAKQQIKCALKSGGLEI